MSFGFWGQPVGFQFGTFRDDDLEGSAGRDLIFGLWGDDLIEAGDGRDTVYGGFGDDTIDGGAGNDRLFGGFGDDVLIGGAGNDRIDGGWGQDTAVFSGSFFDYQITGFGRTTLVSGADGHDRLRSIETLQFDDLTVFLDGRNNAVLAEDDAVSTEENTVLAVAVADLLANDFDFDGDALEITEVSALSDAGVALSFADGVITFDPGTAFDSLAAGETTTDRFTYTVTDNQGATSTATATVTVTGTNDAPVLSLPSSASVDENTTGRVATAAATDVDSSTVTYTLSGADAAFFSIDADTGEVTLNEALDFEAPLDEDGDNIYEVTVTAEDDAGGKDSRAISISVTDLDEGPLSLKQSFETEATGGQYVNAATDGSVLPQDAEVDIENVAGLATVDSTVASDGLLGFNATWVNTRGDAGLSDGDFVGVTDFTGAVDAFTDGIQGYQISDPDGLYRLTFDEVDLTEVGAVTFSLDYFLQETGYEADDLLNIFVVTDQGTEVLLDTRGLDIDDLGIEDAWTTLSVDLGADVNSAQLVVEFDANSGTEAVYIDDVSVVETIDTDGSVLSVVADVESVVEGDGGTTSVTFTVTRAGNTEGETSVDFTIGGEVDAEDFGGTLPSGTVTFADGQTEQTVTVEIRGDTVIEADEALTITLDNPSGDAVIEDGTATTTVLNDDVEFVSIAEIQGSGSSSARVGDTVETTGIVTYVEPDGFYIQMATGDGDAATSDAIFVFVGNDALLNEDGSLTDGGGIAVLGNEVTVTGQVSEFGNLTQLSSALSDVSVDSTGNALPDAVTVTVSATTNADVDYEAVEGMRVEVVSGDPDEALTVIENFSLDRFGEIKVSAGKQVQPTQLFDAQDQAAEVQELQEANANNRLIIDDGDLGQNPDEFAFIPNNSPGDNGNGILDAGDDFDQGGTLRLGTEIVEPIEGVMSEGFGDYRVLATETMTIDESTNSGARPETPDVLNNPGGEDAQDGQLIVTSFNVLNYFTTLDVAGAGTGPNGDLDPRGATSEADLARQTDKLVNAILTTGSDVLALQELENNGFDDASAVATLVEALNLADPDADWQFVDPTDPSQSGFVGTDAITTGIIYDANEVNLLFANYYEFEEASAADTFALADILNPYVPEDDQVGDFQRSRPAVAATFEEKDTGEAFSVVSVHHKSKGDSNLQDLADGVQALLDAGAIPEDEVALVTQTLADLRADANFDQGDGQAYWNQARKDASEELTKWLEEVYLEDAATSGGGQGVTVSSDTLILGDFNAYAKEDPTQSVAEFDGNDADSDPDYVDVIDNFVEGGQDEAFSFVFDGQQGTLDQGFASKDLVEHITGATEWHINAEEPDLLNYDSEFNDAGYYSDNVYGASDHDPLIIGLDFNQTDLA